MENRMKIFRIILWSVTIAVVVTLGVISFGWQKETTTNNEPYGVAFQLIDQKNNEITEAAFREKPTAVFFGFTHCPEICPTTLYELDSWLEQADPNGDKISAYFVSVDPEKDTAEILDLYVGNVTKRVTGITGAPEKISKMLKGFNIYFKKIPLDANEPNGDYTMDHTASIFLLKDGGRFKGTIAYGENPETAIQKLKNLISGS
jgi:protein SCO1/2